MWRSAASCKGFPAAHAMTVLIQVIAVGTQGVVSHHLHLPRRPGAASRASLHTYLVCSVPLAAARMRWFQNSSVKFTLTKFVTRHRL